VIQAEHALRGLEATCGPDRPRTDRVPGFRPAGGGAVLIGPVLATTGPGPRRRGGRASGNCSRRSPPAHQASPTAPTCCTRAERLAATRTRNLDLAYAGAADFLADLRLVQSSLAAAGAVRQAYGELQHLIWQAETFGFHLAGLEVRQHSRVHAQALAQLRAGDPPSAMTTEVLETIRVMAWIQRRYGVDACRRYVISFTTSEQGHRGGVRAGRLRLPRRRRPGARRGAALRDRGRPGPRPVRADRHAVDSRRDRPARRDRAAAGGDARLLGLRQGTRARLGDAAAVRRPGGARGVGGGA